MQTIRIAAYFALYLGRNVVIVAMMLCHLETLHTLRSIMPPDIWGLM
jgi:hypothetical protein